MYSLVHANVKFAPILCVGAGRDLTAAALRGAAFLAAVGAVAAVVVVVFFGGMVESSLLGSELELLSSSLSISPSDKLLSEGGVRNEIINLT